MREKRNILFALFLLFLGGCIFGNGALAAEVSGKGKTAYADPARKALVLHFEEFSKKGYTYSLSSGNKVISKGKLPKDGIYNLDNNYRRDTRYQLQITSSEKNTMTVYYFTGDAVAAFKAAQSGSDINTSWKVKNSATYSGYYVSLYAAGEDLVPKLSSKLTDSKKESQKLSGSGLSNGNYTACLIPFALIDGKEHFGESQSGGLTYIKAPSKVSGVKAVPNTKRVTISWNPSTDAAYFRVYKGTTVKGKYSLAMDNVTATSCTVTGLKPGSKYYFKVEPVAAFDTNTIPGPMSVARSAAVPVVAGRVKGAKAVCDSKGGLILTWNKTDKATSYIAYFKKKTDSQYTKLGETKKQRISLKKLTENTDYQIKVFAVTKVGTRKYRSDLSSNLVELNPVQDTNKILANEVRSITYVGKKREVYTTKKYSKEVKTAFVNYKGYKSPTPYLIWVSHYTQQVSVFKGQQGNWKMIRAFSCATGKASTRSPRGVFKVGRKEKGWYYATTKCLYVTHYCGRNSFHSRPLYKSGGVATATLDRPASHGCVRCTTSNAKYIYDRMPKGTTVVSY
ncbi:MAG: fibronectin type III domain-containing protein [Eubacterium sp.]|nr:fibronectin type III domain-containing protein [Eubacterium sp.]